MCVYFLPFNAWRYNLQTNFHTFSDVSMNFYPFLCRALRVSVHFLCGIQLWGCIDGSAEKKLKQSRIQTRNLRQRCQFLFRDTTPSLKHWHIWRKTYTEYFTFFRCACDCVIDHHHLENIDAVFYRTLPYYQYGQNASHTMDDATREENLGML